MPRKAKRSRSMKVGRRGMGWLWPAQPCGKPYAKFRSGTTFAEAYEWLAYRANERGETFRPSKKRIINAMAQIKRSMFEIYTKSCAVEQGGGPKARTWADCRKVCKVRSNACGKSCVSKKKKCKKLPPADGICNVTDYQTNLDLEQAAADRWDEHRAAGGALPEDGDTSFDFAPEPATAVVVDGDMDFGYEAPSRYGFQGLRGGRGGAAANRGRYKPLPPGQSAIAQVRALEAARADIIRAVESGKFELCEKGVKRAAAPAIDRQVHGQRSEYDMDLIRKRFAQY